MSTLINMYRTLAGSLPACRPVRRSTAHAPFGPGSCFQPLEARLALSGDPFTVAPVTEPRVGFVEQPPSVELINHGAAFARGQTVEFTTTLTGFHDNAELRHYLDDGDNVFEIEQDTLIGTVAADAAQVRFAWQLPTDASFDEKVIFFVPVSDEGNVGPAVLTSFFVLDRTVSLELLGTSFDSAATPGVFRVDFRFTVDGDVNNFDLTSFSSGDLMVQLATGTILATTLISSTPDAASRSVTNSYNFVAPGGGFDYLDNGPATLTLAQDQVVFSGSMEALGSQPLATFNLFFQNPIAEATAVSTSATTLSATVTYTDNTAMSFGSIDASDVELRGPDGLIIPGVLFSASANGTSATSVYTFTAPGGVWDSTDNGTYELWTRPVQVWDDLGFPVASGRLTTYNLFFNDPTAEEASVSVAEGSEFIDVTVRYTDAAGSPQGISFDSVSTGDVELVGPSGFYELGTLVSVGVPQSNGALLATYRFTARNGAWDLSDNGTYTVNMRPGQVSDNQGFLVAPSELSTYNLFFTSPSLSLAATDVADGRPDLLVAVTYQALGSTLMSWDSFGDGDDLSLAGPNGYSAVSSLVSRTYNASSNTYTVTYRFAAPGGTWDTADNGDYTLRTRADEAFDALGRPVAASTLATYSLFF